MAWIPSHQDLRDHPKTRKMAVLLGVSRPAVIGHLHCLWWWALAYAPTGDLADYDDTDLALAAEWDGDASDFVAALIGCGSGGRDGFVDDSPRRIHDWGEHGGKYVERRRVDAERKAAGRAATSDDGPTDVPPMSDGHPTDGARSAYVEGREGREGVEGAPPTRKRSLPAGWVPHDKHATKAKDLNLNCADQAEAFRDHHRAKGTLFKDWDAAFFTWLRNAPGFQPRHLQAVGETSYEPPPVRYT